MDGGEREARVAAFGRWLRQERELRGLPREEVARLTRIAPAVVDALESGEAARMPPRAYLVGYLRSYAGVVGLDADDLVLRWQEAEGASGEAPAAPGAAGGRRRPLALGLALVAVLVLALAAAWLWSGRPRPPSSPERPSRAVDRAPAGR